MPPGIVRSPHSQPARFDYSFIHAKDFLMSESNRWGMATMTLHTGAEDIPGRSVSPAIFQTSTYRWDSVEHGLELSSQEAPTEFYARWGHPNGRQMETIVAALEGTPAALATSSGAAAMTLAILPWVGPGDHVVLARTIYGETKNLVNRILGRFGVRHTVVDAPDVAAYEAALDPATRVIVTETPANPTLDCVDIAALAKLAHALGARLIVDSTFATPINTRPALLGADAVVHSATKYLSGHSDVVAGVIASDAEAISRAWDYLRITGPVLGPFDAWLVARGLRTLELRMARHNANALALARLLERHPAVARVHYPGLTSHPAHQLARHQMNGFGGMLSVELHGGEKAGLRFASRLRLSVPATSLGGVESLVQFPATLARITEDERRASGIKPGLVRLSVGCENEPDLLEDVAQALAD
jgi:methionine-gamma-lyase